MSATVEAAENTAGATPVVSVEKTPAEEVEEDGDEGGADAAPEEEATAVFKPLVDLAEVDVVSGEEHEETIFKLRGKLYRYTETLLDKGSGKKQWIERGVGEIKLLKNRENQQQRFLMRQEKTLKLIVNAMIDPRIKMTKMDSNDKTWVWSCFDFSEAQIVEEVFAFKCANVEDAASFKESFDKACAEMIKVFAGADAAPDSSVDAVSASLSALAPAKE
jgi:Ran-binding protein 1